MGPRKYRKCGGGEGVGTRPPKVFYIRKKGCKQFEILLGNIKLKILNHPHSLIWTFYGAKGKTKWQQGGEKLLGRKHLKML